MWTIFGVKLNYIMILEKLCNSSTLLIELFMICGQLEVNHRLKRPCQIWEMKELVLANLLMNELIGLHSGKWKISTCSLIAH